MMYLTKYNLYNGNEDDFNLIKSLANYLIEDMQQ
jgi:hypothetical protein